MKRPHLALLAEFAVPLVLALCVLALTGGLFQRGLL